MSIYKPCNELHPTMCHKSDCFAHVKGKEMAYCYVLNQRDSNDVLYRSNQESCKFYKSYKKHKLYVPQREVGLVKSFRKKGMMHDDVDV